jgi:hypothetical protein
MLGRTYLEVAPMTPIAKERQIADRTIRPWDIMWDVRRGMNDAAMMAKYNISSRELQRLIEQLLEAAILLESDLEGRM